MTMRTVLPAALLCTLLMPGAASAAEDVFAGKQLTIITAFPAGGTYGIYAHMVARAMPAHMSGKPNIIVQQMPGAGGAKAANYMYNVAPKDGTHMALLSEVIATVQRLRPKAVKYDAAKFQYLGSLTPVLPVVMVWHTAPAKTIAEAKKTELLCGSSGKFAQSYVHAALLNRFVGTKLKLILGYRGSKPQNRAMEQGETNCRSADWGDWKAATPHWVREGKIVPLVQVGLERSPELPQVPTMLELVKDPEHRAVLEFMALSTGVGRAVSVPPGVPAERVAILRKGFAAALATPGFAAEAKKRNVAFDPISWQEVESATQRIVRTPDRVVEAAARALGF